MNWININVSVIDSEEFLGAEPTERATWLCLLRYCCGQENGGRIEDARAWKDRKWQQVVRVTGKEVAAVCDLWKWEGDDLVVAFYPIEKEAEVKTNRLNGSKGGRPSKKKPDGNPTEEPKPQPEQNHPVSDGITEGVEIGETERKGKEGNGIEGKRERDSADAGTRRPTLAQALSAASQIGVTPEMADDWWNAREASDWMKGTAGGGTTPVGSNWQADLKTYASRMAGSSRPVAATSTTSNNQKLDWE